LELLEELCTVGERCKSEDPDPLFVVVVRRPIIIAVIIRSVGVGILKKKCDANELSKGELELDPPGLLVVVFPLIDD